MSIRSGMCYSFKAELLAGIHDFSVDVIKAALYTVSASIGPETTAYTATGEATGTGWGSGGRALTTAATYPKLDPTGQYGAWAFEDETVTGVTITFRGVLLYNSSKANRAIAVYDRGGDVVLTNGPLTLFTNPVQPFLVMVR